MENQVKTSTENKEQQLKKLSKMTMIRSLLPIAGLIIIFLMFNALTNFRMMNNLPLVLSQVYVTMISATGVFFIMTMGGLDFSQGSILGIASIVVCMVSKTSIPLAIVAGIAVGAAIGAINGYFYVYRKIKSFIVTICTMFLFRGFIKYLTTNAPVAGSAMLINFDSTELKLACTLAVLIIGFILFRFTKFGTYLKAIGAADAGDEIFAASCYCPIINLEHADAAYEWQFLGVNEFRRMQMNLTEGGRPEFSAVDGDMTPEQMQTSKDEAALFPEYVNSLGLKDEQGRALTLAADGTGTFLEYVKAIVLESAQKALDRKTDLSGETWLTVEDGRAVGMDFPAYARAITRMKTAPAFDGLELETAENDLFGSENVNCRHFTKYSLQHSKKRGEMAPEQVVRMLNPMSYVDVADAQKAKYFRIRHGECDRDTSLAISAMLVAKLRAQGCSVDYHAPWGVPHAGEYDLDELFAWIDEICR